MLNVATEGFIPAAQGNEAIPHPGPRFALFAMSRRLCAL